MKKLRGHPSPVSNAFAVASVLVPAALRQGPIHAPTGPKGLPTTWSIVHVFDRMEEAYDTLRRLPMATRPRAYANSMPKDYRYDFHEEVAQVETGALADRQQERNRVRLGASAAQIRRMEEALHWPMSYLRDMPEVAQAVGLVAIWTVLKVDIDKACRRRRINKRALHRRQIHGLTIIAQELARIRVPVS